MTAFYDGKIGKLLPRVSLAPNFQEDMATSDQRLFYLLRVQQGCRLLQEAGPQRVSDLERNKDQIL